jgi:hypothetical protein
VSAAWFLYDHVPTSPPIFSDGRLPFDLHDWLEAWHQSILRLRERSGAAMTATHAR